jgi:hypothetical protein
LRALRCPDDPGLGRHDEGRHRRAETFLRTVPALIPRANAAARFSRQEQ